MASKPDAKKAMDVSKPGKTPPDTSARPVIISHRPMVKDPMMKTEGEGEQPKTDEPAVVPSTHGGKVIAPVSDNVAPEDDPAETLAEAEADDKPEESKPDQEEPADKPADNEAAVVEAVADQAELGKDKQKDGELSEEDKKKQEHLEKLIADKKYFVKIGQVAKRRNKRVTVVLLVLLLLLAGGYLAADAGLVKSPVDLPFHVLPQ